MGGGLGLCGCVPRRKKPKSGKKKKGKNASGYKRGKGTFNKRHSTDENVTVLSIAKRSSSGELEKENLLQNAEPSPVVAPQKPTAQASRKSSSSSSDSSSSTSSFSKSSVERRKPLEQNKTNKESKKTSLASSDVVKVDVAKSNATSSEMRDNLQYQLAEIDDPKKTIVNDKIIDIKSSEQAICGTASAEVEKHIDSTSESSFEILNADISSSNSAENLAKEVVVPAAIFSSDSANLHTSIKSYDGQQLSDSRLATEIPSAPFENKKMIGTSFSTSMIKQTSPSLSSTQTDESADTSNFNGVYFSNKAGHLGSVNEERRGAPKSVKQMIETDVEKPSEIFHQMPCEPVRKMSSSSSSSKSSSSSSSQSDEEQLAIVESNDSFIAEAGNADSSFVTSESSSAIQDEIQPKEIVKPVEIDGDSLQRRKKSIGSSNSSLSSKTSESETSTVKLESDGAAEIIDSGMGGELNFELPSVADESKLSSDASVDTSVQFPKESNSTPEDAVDIIEIAPLTKASCRTSSSDSSSSSESVSDVEEIQKLSELDQDNTKSGKPKPSHYTSSESSDLKSSEENFTAVDSLQAKEEKKRKYSSVSSISSSDETATNLKEKNFQPTTLEDRKSSAEEVAHTLSDDEPQQQIFHEIERKHSITSSSSSSSEEIEKGESKLEEVAAIIDEEIIVDDSFSKSNSDEPQHRISKEAARKVSVTSSSSSFSSEISANCEEIVTETVENDKLSESCKLSDNKSQPKDTRDPDDKSSVSSSSSSSSEEEEGEKFANEQKQPAIIEDPIVENSSRKITEDEMQSQVVLDAVRKLSVSSSSSSSISGEDDAEKIEHEDKKTTILQEQFAVEEEAEKVSGGDDQKQFANESDNESQPENICKADRKSSVSSSSSSSEEEEVAKFVNEKEQPATTEDPIVENSSHKITEDEKQSQVVLNAVRKLSVSSYSASSVSGEDDAEMNEQEDIKSTILQEQLAVEEKVGKVSSDDDHKQFAYIMNRKSSTSSNSSSSSSFSSKDFVGKNTEPAVTEDPANLEESAQNLLEHENVCEDNRKLSTNSRKSSISSSSVSSSSSETHSKMVIDQKELSKILPEHDQALDKKHDFPAQASTSSSSSSLYENTEAVESTSAIIDDKMRSEKLARKSSSSSSSSSDSQNEISQNTSSNDLLKNDEKSKSDISSESSSDEEIQAPALIQKPRENITFLSGWRKVVRLVDLISARLVTEKTAKELETGVVDENDVAAELQRYLSGNEPIAGLMLVETGEKMSLFDASKKRLIRRGTAVSLLEAQAATGSIINPYNGTKMSVEEAEKAGLIDKYLSSVLLRAERAVNGFKSKLSPQPLSLFDAMKRNLVVESHGIRLLEAQVATGGIIDPWANHRIPVDVAYERGLFDKKLNKILEDPADDTKGFFDPNTNQNLTYLQLMERCIVDKETSLRLLPLYKKKQKKDYWKKAE